MRVLIQDANLRRALIKLIMYSLLQGRFSGDGSLVYAVGVVPLSTGNQTVYASRTKNSNVLSLHFIIGLTF
jgi:hypothetical protein